MKAVLRLVLTYFTGTALLRAITALGVLGVVGGSMLFLYLPQLLGGQGGPSRFSLGQITLFELAPVAGLLCFVFGASLLPALFSRLASSHYLYVLPYGRIKVLVSAFATLTLVALVVAGTTTVYYIRTPLSLDVIFERAFIVALLTCNLLYVVLWLTSKSTSAIGLLVGSIVTIATLVLPLRFIALPSRSLLTPWLTLALLWSLFAAAFLLAPRLKRAGGRIMRRIAAPFSGASYDGGAEIDFLLGTARPWALAAGLIVPVLMASYFLSGFEVTASAPSPWLFFLAILSILSGTMASMAATRSRRLWLRARWTRAELFRRVEDAFWRHNSYALGVLLVLLVVLGTHFYLPTKMLALGMGLLALGMALSTYLGLMITARVSWLDALLAVATMLALMIAAKYASMPTTATSTGLAFEAALAALTLVFRRIAQHRWMRLDWMRCRAEPGVRAVA